MNFTLQITDMGVIYLAIAIGLTVAIAIVACASVILKKQIKTNWQTAQ